MKPLAENEMFEHENNSKTTFAPAFKGTNQVENGIREPSASFGSDKTS